MKYQFILIISAFILVFAIDVAAQTTLYPNELAGYKFFGSGRLKGVQLLVSSKDDVKRIFGESCEKQCDLDTDWSVGFEYFDDIWTKERSNIKGDKATYYLDPKYLGKLRVIEIRPKKRIPFAGVTFTDAFKKVIVTSTSDKRTGSRVTISTAYQDADGLTYEIFESTDLDALDQKNVPEHIKGDLVVIRYNIRQDQEKGLFVLPT